MSADPLRQDQDDFHGLLAADEFFAHTPALLQHKGVTEDDINVALSTMLDRAGKSGSCVVVIMPELQPDASQGPAARYFVRIAIQVIVQPLLADDPTNGVGKTAEQLAERVRQICHARGFGRSNTFMFDGMEPLPADPGKNSYGVYFRRIGGDTAVAKVAMPGATAVAANLPATGWNVTLNLPPGSTGYYTLDGSLPTALNGTVYAAPFNVPVAALMRAIAMQTGFQQSEPKQLTLV